MSSRARSPWRVPAPADRRTREDAALVRVLDDVAEALAFVRDPRLRERLMILAVVIQEPIHARRTADGDPAPGAGEARQPGGAARVSAR